MKQWRIYPLTNTSTFFGPPVWSATTKQRNIPCLEENISLTLAISSCGHRPAYKLTWGEQNTMYWRMQSSPVLQHDKKQTQILQNILLFHALKTCNTSSETPKTVRTLRQPEKRLYNLWDVLSPSSFGVQDGISSAQMKPDNVWS